MKQPILLGADIDEDAKISHVGNDALDLPSDRQFACSPQLDRSLRRHEGLSRVAGRVVHLAHQVAEHGGGKLSVLQLLERHRVERLGIFEGLGGRQARRGQNLFHRRVSQRVKARIVERIFAPADAGEAGGLFVDPVAQPGDVFELFAFTKTSNFLAMLDHPPGSSLGQAGNQRQHLGRRRIQVDPDLVEDRLERRKKPVAQTSLVNILMKLTDTRGAGVDEHELPQRILQAPRQTGRAALRDRRAGHAASGVF